MALEDSLVLPGREYFNLFLVNEVNQDEDKVVLWLKTTRLQALAAAGMDLNLSKAAGQSRVSKMRPSKTT